MYTSLSYTILSIHSFVNLVNGGMYMEKIIEERILENLNDEEKKSYIDNKNIIKKVYIIGLLDSFNNRK